MLIFKYFSRLPSFCFEVTNDSGKRQKFLVGGCVTTYLYTDLCFFSQEMTSAHAVISTLNYCKPHTQKNFSEITLCFSETSILL